jgi:hypothetical protein
MKSNFQVEYRAHFRFADSLRHIRSNPMERLMEFGVAPAAAAPALKRQRRNDQS